MPAVDDPFSIAASLPGQMATLKGQLKDLSVNNTQALTQALAAATAAAGSAATASAAATAAANAATAARVVPVVNSSSAAGFTLTTSYAILVIFGLIVPSGCTRALVSASGFVSNVSSSTTGDRLYVLAAINGVAGPESNNPMGASNPVGAASAFQTQNLSGLTPGGTISIALQAHITTGPGSSFFANATLSAMAIFQV